MKDSYTFYKDKLNEEYLPVFEQVEIYVLTQNIDESTIEERLGDLLEMFLNAQNEGKPVRKIVGNNTERFCKTFCSDLGMKHRILKILDNCKIFAWISIIDIIFMLIDSSETVDGDIWHSVGSLNVSVYLIAVILSSVLIIVVNNIIRHIMFKMKRFSMKTFSVVACVECVVSFAGIFIAVSRIESTPLDPPAWIVAVVSCLYLVIYYLLFAKRLRRPKIKLSDLAGDDVITGVSQVMEKRFEKAKKKNLRNGKGELSITEFLDMEEKLCDRAEKTRYFYYLFPAIITLVTYVVVYMTDGFETAVDSIIFIVILLAVEYAILLSIWKITKLGVNERREWIRGRREKI